MLNRFQLLDGWRGISILLVLLGHLIPLSPKNWQLNYAASASGMALFFILSGFLITNLLIKDQNVTHFIIRRFLRIVPLAWVAMIISFIAFSTSKTSFIPHFLFYANLNGGTSLTPQTGHLWSLCVEMQFYVAIATLIALLKKKAFLVLPFIAIAITINRFVHGVEININTFFRVDEILAGCILALIYHQGSDNLKQIIGKINPYILLMLLFASAHPEGHFLNYLRPYIAMLMIGSTLFTIKTSWYDKLLKSQFLFYIASISYALYVVHGILVETWLGEGNTIIKYAKRPLLLLVTFAIAHFSTFYYEKYWINLGKKLTARSNLASEKTSISQV